MKTRRTLPLLALSLLLATGCATRSAITELKLDDPTRVGLAVPPPDADPAKWLAPPAAGPSEARARLVSPATGISEAPEVEVRRASSGSLTLLCRPCDRGWIDVVDDRGLMSFPGSLDQLEEKEGQLHLPLRVVTARELKGAPEGDLALEKKTYADLVAIFPREAVRGATERVVHTRPRSWTTTGVLSGSGLLVGGAGVLMLATEQEGRRWPGGVLLGAGLSMIVGAAVEALLPRRSEAVREVSF
ncbi:MAG: hypothetical protein P1V51_16865 [Deltaproteobacteria bacterium]|nr:hypothetical protein [Deltaproteobacteria bacterium]